MQDATDVDIPEPDAPPRRRRWWWAVGGGVLLLLLAAVAASVYFLVPGMRGTEPENTAKYFPEDTAIYGWATFSPGIGQGAEMRELWNRLEELPGFEDAVDGLLEDAEAETGIDFEQQVLPWIGPDVSVGVLNLGAGDQTGELVALIGVRDHGAASAFVRDLSGNAQLDGVSLKRDDDIHGFEVRTDWGTGVGLALSSDWLVLASSEAALNDVVERIATPEQRSLADSDRFQQARTAMRDERAMSAYLDLEAVVGFASELSDIGAAMPPLHHHDRMGAVPVTVGDAVPGALHSVDEADILVFDGEASTQYQIDVTLGTLADSVATLYDADGVALARNDDHDLSLASRIVWLAEHSGPYYVVVEGYAGDTGSYTLAVTADTETADAAAGTVGDSGLPDWVALSVGFVDLGIVIEWASPLDSSAFADIALDDEPAALLPDDTVFFGAAAFEPDMDRWRTELGTYTVAGIVGADVANELAAETGLEADSTLAELLDEIVEVIDDEIGISLEEDLFDLLGGQALLGVRNFDLERVAEPEGYAIDAIAAVSYIPGGEEGLRRTVDKLVDRLEEAWGESFPARASKDIGADHEAVTFGGAGIEDAAAYSPGYVFHDGYLTVATTERALQSVVDAQKGTRGTLAETREYRRVRDSLPDTLDFLVYIDLHRIIAGLDPDALDLDPDLHHVLESVFGAVAVGASSDDDYARASLVMTLFPQ